MRVLVKAHLGVESANQAIADGTLGVTLQQFMQAAKPEAAYFGTDRGTRTAWFVFDLVETSQLPPLLEPLFQHLGARVAVTPVMNPEDLQKGLQQLN